MYYSIKDRIIFHRDTTTEVDEFGIGSIGREVDEFSIGKF